MAQYWPYISGCAHFTVACLVCTLTSCGYNAWDFPKILFLARAHTFATNSERCSERSWELPSVCPQGSWTSFNFFLCEQLLVRLGGVQTDISKFLQMNNLSRAGCLLGLNFFALIINYHNTISGVSITCSFVFRLALLSGQEEKSHDLGVALHHCYPNIILILSECSFKEG